MGTGIRSTAEIATANGFQLNIHAIGDRANREVLDIYEQEKDWTRAIEMTRLVESDPRDLAQYYCELAASESAQSRPDAARKHLEEDLAQLRRLLESAALPQPLQAT